MSLQRTMLLYFWLFISTTMEKDNNSGPPVSSGWGMLRGSIVGMSIVIRPPPVWDISDKHTTITLTMAPALGWGERQTRHTARKLSGRQNESNFAFWVQNYYRTYSVCGFPGSGPGKWDSGGGELSRSFVLDFYMRIKVDLVRSWIKDCQAP